jgi:hypothetical protein
VAAEAGGGSENARADAETAEKTIDD